MTTSISIHSTDSLTDTRHIDLRDIVDDLDKIVHVNKRNAEFNHAENITKAIEILKQVIKDSE